MAFCFRHFTVEDDRSTMPVGTDSMLLGAWADPGDACNILDIGTGCGVLALMMAQRSGGSITGIDRDRASAEQASSNFTASPWSHRLKSVNARVEDWSVSGDGSWDFIISNPPFFSGSLKSPSARRSLARHGAGLSLRLFPSTAARLLSPVGRFALVLPAESLNVFIFTAEEAGFRAERLLMVRSFRHLAPVRALAQFSKSAKNETIRQELIIFDAPGRFSGGYLEMTSDFHLFK